MSITPHVLAFAVLATLTAAWAGARGIRLLLRGLRCGDDPSGPLWVVRGLRGVIIAVSATALASGVLLDQLWLLVFGGTWLAEEIYETGVLALILRAGHRQATEGASTAPSGLR